MHTTPPLLQHYSTAAMLQSLLQLQTEYEMLEQPETTTPLLQLRSDHDPHSMSRTVMQYKWIGVLRLVIGTAKARDMHVYIN
jgi:hypothetical protein